MRFNRLFNRTPPADPFAVFAQTYGIKTPQDTPPPKAEPEEPQPVEVGLTRAHQLLGVPLGASRQVVRPTGDSPSSITLTGWRAWVPRQAVFGGEDEGDKRCLLRAKAAGSLRCCR